jgi:hypothetical protein
VYRKAPSMSLPGHNVIQTILLHVSEKVMELDGEVLLCAATIVVRSSNSATGFFRQRLRLLLVGAAAAFDFIGIVDIVHDSAAAIAFHHVAAALGRGAAASSVFGHDSLFRCFLIFGLVVIYAKSEDARREFSSCGCGGEMKEAA